MQRVTNSAVEVGMGMLSQVEVGMGVVVDLVVVSLVVEVGPF